MKASQSNLSQHDLQELRTLLRQSGNELDMADFNELIALESIQANLHLWRNQSKHLIAFALVDDFNNLRYALDEKYCSAALEFKVVDWGVNCMRRRNLETGEQATLDACCTADNQNRLDFLERHAFRQENVRTLHYQRSLLAPIPQPALPAGFHLRSVQGEQQAGMLAALHRAAFGTEHMTLEYRLGMMRLPNYDPSLDLYIEASNGDPLAFCVGTIAAEENQRDGSKNGYTDPIGVDPRYQGQGFGRAVLLAGLQALRSRGMESARLGTSSENISMQRLAEALGFRVVSENIWFSKTVV
jgi:mycothiol synthase